MESSYRELVHINVESEPETVRMIKVMIDTEQST